MKIDRRHLYDHIRDRLFGGGLSQPQVDGIEAILDECESQEIIDLSWIAYILATAYYETGQKMEAATQEIGRGRGHPYGQPHPKTGKVYYGRGFTQLTWYDNYKKLGKRIGEPLEAHPDLALRKDIAAKIIVVGMIEGLFTGERLATYFNVKSEDWVGARRIVNGLDRAEQIAEYGKQFRAALRPATDKNYEGRFEGKDGPLAEQPKKGVQKAVTAFLTAFVTLLGMIGVAVPAWVTPELISQIGWFAAILMSLGGSIPITLLTWLIPNDP